MDHRSFDRLARLLGEATDRRTGLKALVGGILGIGAATAARDADAKRKRRDDRDRDQGLEAGKRTKKRKKCTPACDAGFTCVKGQCTCSSGVACAGACCADGQVCRDGECAEPRPACLPFGEACKNAGRPCCDGLTCASGQDGSFPVTCLRSKGSACAGDEECPFGMSCAAGVCAGNGAPGVPTGVACAAGATCDQPGAVCSAYTTPGAPQGDFCTLPLRKVCAGDPDCTCYNCWYVNDGATIGGRQGREAAPVKACIQPKGAECSVKTDCALGLDCVGGVCTGTAQCAPGGAPCANTSDCCQGGTCQNGTCSGGGGGGKQVGDACTSTGECPNGSTCAAYATGSGGASGTYCLLPSGAASTSAAHCEGNVIAGGNCRTCTVYGSGGYASLTTALVAAQDDATNSTKNPVYVGAGTYAFPGEGRFTLVLTSKSTTAVEILACDPLVRPVFDGGATVTFANDTTTATGSEWPSLNEFTGYGILDLRYSSGDCTDAATCGGFKIDGINFQNSNSGRDTGSHAGAIMTGARLTLSNSAITRCKSMTGAIIATQGANLTNVSIRQCYGTGASSTNAGGMYIQLPGTMQDVAVEYNGSASNAGGARLNVTSIPTASVTLDNVSIRYNSPTGLVNADPNTEGKKIVCSGTTKSCGNPANASATATTNCGGNGTYDSTCGSTVCVGDGTAGSGTC